MIDGRVEVIRPFQVRGWAYDDNDPDRPVTVTLLLAGAEIATAQANFFRSDLADSGKGNGRHGFVLNLDCKLPLDNPEMIKIVARSGLDEIIVGHLDNVVAEDVSPRPKGLPWLNSTPIIGYFTPVPPYLGGWAFHPQYPNEHLTIEIAVGGSIVGSGVADQFRADLVGPLAGNGDHGFSLTLGYLGKDVDIRVTARAANGDSGMLRLAASGASADVAVDERARPVLPFPGDCLDAGQRPLFILGAARSGTSAVAQALTATTSYVGHEEGHLLDLIGPLLKVVGRYYQDRAEEWDLHQHTMIGAVPANFLEDGIRHIFVELARLLFPNGRWLDKTPRPEMVAVAPLLRQVWPQARFVFMKRRGIENIVSRRAKFPHVPFVEQCRDWALVMQNWTAVRGALAEAAIEIEQLVLATQPHTVANELAPLLDLLPQEVDALARALEADRPERTAERFGDVSSLDALAWTDQEKREFVAICGPMMQEFRYSFDDTYNRLGN